MNIEEAIKNIKKYIYLENGERVNYIDLDNTCGVNDIGECDEFIQSIETLINAYKDSTPNQVIRDKIKELDGAIDYVDIAEYSISPLTDKIEVLKELLGGEEDGI